MGETGIHRCTGRLLLVAVLVVAALTWPAAALAADDAAAPSGFMGYTVLFSAVLNGVIALGTATYVAAKARATKAADDRIEAVERQFGGRLAGISARHRELDELLHRTREEFARKSEVDNLRVEIRDIRRQQEEHGRQLAEQGKAVSRVEQDVLKILDILQPAGSKRG